MASRPDHIPARRAIIDRRAVATAMEGKTGAEITIVLRAALDAGRREIERRLAEKPYAGTENAHATAFLTDQIVRLVHDHVTGTLYPLSNPTTGERLLLLAVGGYGRAEMAPHSDVDIGFITPWKPVGWTEQVIEAILYQLWDLGLKLGHSVRSVDEMISAARADHTVKTAMLEARYLWGDQALYDEAAQRYHLEVAAGNVRQFVTEKLEERDLRHQRMGDSRYVVEPNVKEGKGGLRDLHTLFWIGKYAYKVQSAAQLVDVGLFTKPEFQQFQRAERFLWAVRCHLHAIAGRAEERLTFDYQREIARRMNYADRPGNASVERFMKHYFLHARHVGDLTGVFLAHLDEQFAKRGRLIGLPSRKRRPHILNGFALDRGRLAIPSEKFLHDDPKRLIEAFVLADCYGLEIHPMAMRAIANNAKLIDASVRADPKANAFFMEVLASPRSPEAVLRWMNEAGIFGRFVPDFGRVVAQMQFDMYHHYTVDEHTIRAIGLLSRIEKEEAKADLPLATAMIKRIASRRVLYVAVLLHDIAKGRGGDHSVVGEEIARTLCPRFGLDKAETETVAWLVRWHLLMSATAQKRDLSDPKTITDFVDAVQSPERMRLLYLLTVVDISAVGPGTWTTWKGQLLGELFESAEEQLRLGHKQQGRAARVAAIQRSIAERLDWPADAFAAYAARLGDAYWLAEPSPVLEQNARFIRAAQDNGPSAVELSAQPERQATLVSVYTKDVPGLFYRIAGAISLSGGNIIDARIHTTGDGMALDNILVQDGAGGCFTEDRLIDKLERAVRAAVAGEEPAVEKLEARPLPMRRAEAFTIEPALFVDNKASGRYTVVEVNARDRAALLSELAKAMYDAGAAIRSAHVATYGERAVDVFYLTDRQGGKIEGKDRLGALRAHLLAAAQEPGKRKAA